MPAPSSPRSRRRPDATAELIGKPEAPLLELALDAAGGGRPLVVGDRLDTDIAGASRLGWDSVLVLTGSTRREDVRAIRLEAHVRRGRRGRPGLSGPRPGGAGYPASTTANGRTDPDGARRRQESARIDDRPQPGQGAGTREALPGAAAPTKDQVAKTASDLLRVSQRLRDAVRKEVTSRIKSMGAATQDDLDALRKRVRDLERRAGHDRVRSEEDRRSEEDGREADDGLRDVVVDRRRVVGLVLTDRWAAAASTPSSCVAGWPGTERRRRKRSGPDR